MDKPRSSEVDAFWQAYSAACRVPEQDYDVCRMGSSPEMGDELLALILAGPKRATAYLLRAAEVGGEMIAASAAMSWCSTAPAGRAPSGARGPSM
jgi:hypothetical protein